MVGKRMFDQPQPGMTQMIEKSPRIANASHGVDGAAAKAGQSGRDAGIDQIRCRVTAQAHEIFVTPRRAVANDEIHFTQPGGWLA